MTLAELGWSDFFAQQVQDSESGLLPARVCRQDVNQYHLIAEDRFLKATLPGKLRRRAYSKSDLPAVGDWVVASLIPGSEPDLVKIERVLERKSKFSRQMAGDTFDEQMVAANMDTVFVVCGLDEDFNLARIERYLLLSMKSGAEGLVIVDAGRLRADGHRAGGLRVIL